MNSPLFTSMSAELAKKNKFIIDLQWSLNNALRDFNIEGEFETTQLVALLLSVFHANTDLYDHEEMLSYYASLSPQHAKVVELIISRYPIGTRVWHTLESVLFEPMRSLFPLGRTEFKSLYCELYRSASLLEGKKHPNNTSMTRELERLIFNLLGDTEGESIYAPYGISPTLLLGDYSKVLLESSYYLQSLQDFLALEIEGEVKQLDFSKLDTPTVDHCSDLMVSIPPLGMKLKSETSGGKILRVEVLALEKALEGTLNGSVKNAVVICSQSLLLNSDFYTVTLRKKLVDAGVVSSVTLLPPNMWSGTGIQLVLIHLRKRKFDRSAISLGFSPIRFVNATNFVEGRILKVDELLPVYVATPIKDISVDHVFGLEDELFDMNVQRLTAYVEPVIVPDGYTMLELGGLAECARVRASVDFGKLVKASDFPRDGRPSSFNDVDSVALPKSKPVEVDRDALLVSTIVNSGVKVNAFKYDGESIYLSSSVIALYFDKEKVTSRWLAIAMRSNRIQELLVNHVVGSAITRIKWSSIQNIEFPVPSLGVQAVESSKQEKEFDEERARELGLEEYVDKSRQGYLDALSVAKHNLVDSLAVVKPKVKVLMKTLENKGNLMADDEIGRHGLTVKEYLESVHQGLLSLGNLVKELGSHELLKEEGSANLVKCLDDLIRELSSERVSIELKFSVSAGYLGSEFGGMEEVADRNNMLYRLYKDKEVYVGLSEGNLRKVINQIIQNALSHNEGGAHLNVMICICFTVDGGVSLMCSNDGVAFPKQLTLKKFVTKGETLGASGNTGTGGYIINEVMTLVKGGVKIHHLDRIRTEGYDEAYGEMEQWQEQAQGFAHVHEDMNACVELIFPNLEL